MIINSKTGDIELRVYDNKKEIDLLSIFKMNDRVFNYKINIFNSSKEGKGIRGDEAIWIPFSTDKGLKIILDIQSFDNIETTLKLIDKAPSNIFPSIYQYEVCKTDKGQKLLVMILENINDSSNFIKTFIDRVRNIKNIVPLRDLSFIIQKLSLTNNIKNKIIDEITKLNLVPEDEWYKKTNLINGKIVDFHRFKQFKKRYSFPVLGMNTYDLLDTHMKILARYSNVIDKNNIPQWRGKLYQGMLFDNGYRMEGYSSDNYRFDSYSKLPLIPLNKIKGKDVLDIGSNQGFFSFQSAIHGARKVVGVEFDSNDVKTSNELKDILKLDNIIFKNDDIRNYIFETKDNFELIIMNSVLHLIYPHFKGSEPFLEIISKKCNYFAFETPINHTLVNIKASVIYQKLSKYFKVVRLLNIYNAYSSGYRANFICYK